MWYPLQKLKVVKQAPETYGSFYSGDSYIVLVVSNVHCHFFVSHSHSDLTDLTLKQIVPVVDCIR